MMSKKILNPYEQAMLEFFQIALGDDYQFFPQVSLNEACRPIKISDKSLKKFLFSSSAVDLLIADREFRTCLVVEFQSHYHDLPKIKVQDQKKAQILALAKIPLLCTKIEKVRFLHLLTNDEERVFNLLTNEGRNGAEEFVRRCCKVRLRES